MSSGSFMTDGCTTGSQTWLGSPQLHVPVDMILDSRVKRQREEYAEDFLVLMEGARNTHLVIQFSGSE
jgi:hypothetical protein